MPLDPLAVEAGLVAYYDAEEDRASRELDARRVATRDDFIATLASGRRVLEVGSGPGREAAAFVTAGHAYVAVDLSFGHAARCRATGAAAVQASVRQLPVRTAGVDVVWSMSTLMHVPESAIDGALAEVRRVLAPGGRAVIGVWGGADEERFSDVDEAKGRPARLFSRRSDERWRAMLARVGDVETFERWTQDGEDWVYQWAVVRSAASPA